jgi:electron-transferring-flavoprotein dehydrogenase
VTSPTLGQFLPEETVADRIGTSHANHIAYQEHRRFPPEAFEPGRLKFWWGHIPGETAYPWVFPNDNGVARVGLTMPIGVDLDALSDRSAYPLLDADDETVPDGSEYLRRLLERAYPGYDIEEDMPLVEDRGKRGGTEAYAISSTRPIESPVGADIAVVGGAMGATSAFHEGGYHVAIRTGKIAGELAATGDLGRYNDAWQAAIGDEILRNVTFADLVAEYEPTDWDHVFRTVERLQGEQGHEMLRGWRLSGGLAGAKLLAAYKWRKLGFRQAGYVQLREREYAV